MIVIGVGNPWRGDDAAGPRLARRLASRGVRAVVHEGDATALLDLWAGDEHVVVADAARSGAPAGTIHRFDARARPLPATALRSSTHAFGVADAVELARALGRLPLRLEVVAIEGAGFHLGEPLSPAVERAVETLAAELAGAAQATGPPQT